MSHGGMADPLFYSQGSVRLICLLVFDPLICSYFPPILGSRFMHGFNACMVELEF